VVEPRHENAVANSLSWADQAATDGDYAEALAWLQMLEAINIPLPEPYSTKRAVWMYAGAAGAKLTAARKNLLLAEPTATQRMLNLSRTFETATEIPAVLDAALEGAMELFGTDLGNIQLKDSSSGALVIATSSGFSSEFLEYFAAVSDDSSACGRAAQQGSQTVIADVNDDPGFAPHREIAAASRFRAVQSTPILDRAGRLRGVISTHFRNRYLPTPTQMQLIAWYSEILGTALAGSTRHMPRLQPHWIDGRMAV
jgi:hypothetical protein